MKEKVLPGDISWEQLDKSRFYLLSTLTTVFVRTVAFPLGVVKTKLQAQSHQNRQYSGFIDAIRKTVAADGLMGLYKGYWVSLSGAVPSQLVYVITYEYVKSKVRRELADSPRTKVSQDLMSSFVGGACGGLASQLVTVPVDVVSQRLMVQSRRGRADDPHHYTNSVDAFGKIIKSEGIHGLYRGFSSSLVNFATSSAIWWTTYTAARPYLSMMPINDVLQSALAGALSGWSSTLCTIPLDVIRTRVQVDLRGGKLVNARSVIRTLWREEGWKGFTRGLSARLSQTTPISIMIVIIYEQVKKLSVSS